MKLSSSLFLLLSILCALFVTTASKPIASRSHNKPRDDVEEESGAAAAKKTNHRHLKKSEGEGNAAGYRKAKKYFRKYAKAQTPDKDHYLFYTYNSNCTEILSAGLTSVNECNLHKWDGTVIGMEHFKCDFVGGVFYDETNTIQNPLISCDRFRKFESGNYFYEKTLLNLVDPIWKSIILGGTGTFVGAQGDAISVAGGNLVDYFVSGEPLPPAPTVWFVKSLYAKEEAHAYWNDFDPEMFGVVPPDFTAVPEWAQED